MRGHDFYPCFTKLSCVVFADCRSIKKLHNQRFGDLFSKMWADDTIRKLKLMQMILFMHLVTLDSQNFTFQSKHCMADHSKNHVRACVFSVFRALKILNGYSLSG